MPEIHDERVTSLSAVPSEVRAAWLAAASCPDAASVPALRQIEVGGEPIMPTRSESTLLLAAWNLERCRFPAEAGRILARLGIDLALLSEMDHGCHRTNQLHTTAELAAEMGHAYAYGVEFVELAAMAVPGERLEASSRNRLGFHGNGFVSAIPFGEPVVIRLDPVADWFSEGGQKRVGGRMAVAAHFSHGVGEFVACSVHLESRSTAQARLRQMSGLLDVIDRYAGRLPVVIGGDLNVDVLPGGWNDPDEHLFALATSRGYDWSACNDAGPTTRPSFWSERAALRQLDWFCTRGFRASLPQIIPAVDDEGMVLSDHDLIVVTLAPA